LELRTIVLLASLGLCSYGLYTKSAQEPDATVVVAPVVSTGNYSVDVKGIFAAEQKDEVKRKHDALIWTYWFRTGADQIKAGKDRKIPASTQGLTQWIDEATRLHLVTSLSSKYPALTDALAAQMALVLREPGDPAGITPTQVAGKPLTDAQRERVVDVLNFFANQTAEVAK